VYSSDGGLACARVWRALFWLSACLLAWAQVGYGVLLAVLGRGRRPSPDRTADRGREPMVTLVVAAYREEATIAAKLANALALDWPRDRLEIIVAVDGDVDDTARQAREAGADVVLELPRGGKMRAQDAAVSAARGELIAFSDANAMWEPDAMRALAGAFADPSVSYACGQVTFFNEAGTNQEGLYWRYEMWLRAHESALHSITAGNGAIYAVRRADYVATEPPMGHDLSFPFRMVKRGRRAVYVPAARATERMVPTIEGEWERKRRMMNRAWQIILISGIADPRGYPPLYALMITSHRLLRYASPFLHVLAVLASLVLARGSGARLYRAALAAQLAVLAAAGGGRDARARPLLVARYYVLTTAAIAAGLYDHLRDGTPAGWEAAEGTR
jgi:cellulose synthase/poly-beta-1,6-N-acetylglucosamine synthase-like glycosyltransferase